MRGCAVALAVQRIRFASIRQPPAICDGFPPPPFRSGRQPDNIGSCRFPRCPPRVRIRSKPRERCAPPVKNCCVCSALPLGSWQPRLPLIVEHFGCPTTAPGTLELPRSSSTVPSPLCFDCSALSCSSGRVLYSFGWWGLSLSSWLDAQRICGWLGFLSGRSLSACSLRRSLLRSPAR